MKTKGIDFLIIIVLLVFTSCMNTFHVDTPKANQTSSQEFTVENDHLSLKITFNHPVDINSVVVGKTFIVKTDKVNNATGTLKWDEAHKQVTFVSTQTTGELLEFDSDGNFSIELIGTDAGNGAIKDTSGHLLDGNSDNVHGGNFKTSYVLIG